VMLMAPGRRERDPVLLLWLQLCP